jgi:hypothetical protein
MNKSRMNKNIGLLVMAAGLSACVTINIYFPAAAAEKAADKIIDEVWQLKDAETKPAQPGTEASPEAKPSDAPAK